MDWTIFLLSLPILAGPALVYLWYARALSGWDKSPWKWLLAGLVFGGAVSALAGTVEGFLKDTLNLTLVQSIVVLAPVAEETGKSIWAWAGWARSKALVRGEEAGLASGLGFGVVEASAYAALGYAAGGWQLALITVLLRSISGVAFHGSTGALEGRAIAKGLRPFLVTLGAMMVIHGASNYLFFLLPGWWSAIAAVGIGLGMFAVSEAVLRRTETKETKPEPGTG